MVESYVCICGALGLRFSDLLERCVAPDSDLYWNAIAEELKKPLPPGFSDDKKSLQSLQNLAFGMCSVVAWLLRVSSPKRCAEALHYPADSLREDFISLANDLEVNPLTMKQRGEFLRKLQSSPIAAMRSAIKLPTPQMVVDQIARDESKKHGVAGSWWPFELSAQIEVWDDFQPMVEASRKKRLLTESETLSKVAAVKAQLPSLLERLKKATNATGKKSELAEFLKAPLASVSRWLSGEREPGGEVALQMLHWVEQQERKK